MRQANQDMSHTPCTEPNCRVCRAQRDLARREEEKAAFDRVIANALHDFETWFWAEQTAIRAVHRVSTHEAARAVSIAVLKVAAIRMRALGVDLREVLAVVKDAWESRRVKKEG